MDALECRFHFPRLVHFKILAKMKTRKTYRKFNAAAQMKPLIAPNQNSAQVFISPHPFR